MRNIALAIASTVGVGLTTMPPAMAQSLPGSTMKQPLNGARVRVGSTFQFSHLMQDCTSTEVSKRQLCRMYIMGALDYQATLDDVKGGPPTLCQSAAADWTTAIDAIIQNLAEVYRTKPMLNQTDAALGVHYIATELYACRRRSRVEFRPGDWDERGGLEKVHSPGIRQPIFVGSDALLTNNDIVAVSVRTETDGSYVDVELSKDGGRIFRAWSSMNVGRPMVIFVDGTIVAAPISVGRIENNRFTISGNNTPEFAKALADALMK